MRAINAACLNLDGFPHLLLSGKEANNTHLLYASMQKGIIFSLVVSSNENAIKGFCGL